MSRLLALLSLGALALAAPALHAQAVPTTISYQGALTEPDGDPVPDGTYTVALRLFTAASGGLSSYAETHTVTTVGGVFSAELGAGTPTTGTWANVTFDKGYWLETAVNGTTFGPRTKLLAGPYARALTLPYAASVGLPGALLRLTNTTGSGLRGESASTTGAGVWGEATSATGVSYGGFFLAASTDGRAVYGQATAASGTTYGVYGTAASPQGRGVYGGGSGTYGGYFESAASTGTGVYGAATSTAGFAYGGFFRSASSDGRAVYGQATATNGTAYGVYGAANSTSGRGVYGYAAAATGSTYGVHGASASSSGRGVFGEATAASGASYGGYFTSAGTSGRGVFGQATAATGATYGVRGISTSTGGTGVYGAASAATGDTYGGYFTSSSNDGVAVYGESMSTNDPHFTYGAHFMTNAPDGVGVRAEAASAATPSNYGYGVYATAEVELGIGVFSQGEFTGVWGASPITGVEGHGTGLSGVGVFGGTSGTTSNARAVYAGAGGGSSYAGYFSGRVHVTGHLSKGGGSFEIDHPLDPEGQILRHSFVESPDMMNVYNGNVTTDARGYATVELPEWFEALNRDFRYQLTTVGSFSRAMIAEEIEGNRFVIRTEEPGVRVSWQVTGVRQDAWAEENRIVVEEAKPAEQRGRYLHPSAFGLPRERGVDYDFEREREAAAARLQAEHAERTEREARRAAHRRAAHRDAEDGE